MLHPCSSSACRLTQCHAHPLSAAPSSPAHKWLTAAPAACRTTPLFPYPHATRPNTTYLVSVFVTLPLLDGYPHRRSACPACASVGWPHATLRCWTGWQSSRTTPPYATHSPARWGRGQAGGACVLDLRVCIKSLLGSGLHVRTQAARSPARWGEGRGTEAAGRGGWVRTFVRSQEDTSSWSQRPHHQLKLTAACRGGLCQGSQARGHDRSLKECCCSTRIEASLTHPQPSLSNFTAQVHALMARRASGQHYPAVPTRSCLQRPHSSTLFAAQPTPTPHRCLR